eukprot:g17599.t1
MHVMLEEATSCSPLRHLQDFEGRQNTFLEKLKALRSEVRSEVDALMASEAANLDGLEQLRGELEDQRKQVQQQKDLQQDLQTTLDNERARMAVLTESNEELLRACEERHRGDVEAQSMAEKALRDEEHRLNAMREALEREYQVQQQQLDAEFDAATNLLLCAREQLSKRERHPPRSGISILWISVCMAAFTSVANHARNGFINATVTFRVRAETGALGPRVDGTVTKSRDINTEYKFVIKRAGGQIQWEDGPNRLLPLKLHPDMTRPSCSDEHPPVTLVAMHGPVSSRNKHHALHEEGDGIASPCSSLATLPLADSEGALSEPKEEVSPEPEPVEPSPTPEPLDAPALVEPAKVTAVTAPAKVKTVQAEPESIRFEAGAHRLSKPSGRCEDAFFFSTKAAGVADGVGQMEQFSEYGVDAAKYADELMQLSAKHVHANPGRPIAALMRAERDATSYGACTALVMAIDGTKVQVANLGDSGFMHLRPRAWGMEILQTSREQTHGWNCPYQLTRVPEALFKDSGISFDSAADCEKYELKDFFLNVLSKEACGLELLPDVFSYGAAASACEGGGHWVGAAELLEVLQDSQQQPDTVLCNAVISALQKLALKDEGCVNSALRACERASAWVEALHLASLSELDVAGLVAVTGACASVHAMLPRLLWKANQLARLESAGDIQRKMRKDHTQCAPRLTRVMSLDGVWAPVVPLLVTYNQSDLLLLFTDGLTDNLHWYEVLRKVDEVVERYEGQGVNPEVLASVLAKTAEERSHDTKANTPFAQSARRHRLHFPGGKEDDITVVAAWIAGEEAHEGQTDGEDAVCGLIRAEWLENRYSGLFQKADYGLARLSMMRPYRPDAWHFMPSSLFGESLDHGPCAPAMALKFFRGGQAPSGNLLLVGQPSSIEKDGVGQCLCSQSAQVGCDGADSNPLLSRHSAEFRNLKEPSEVLTPSGSHFVVEGPEAIRLLLASDFVTEKVLLKPSLLDSLRPNLHRSHTADHQSADRNEVLVLLCDATLMEQVTGIRARHASAALALARRPRRAVTCQECLPDGPLRALALAGLDEESVGALFRVAAAFGVDLVLLDSTCADPFHRRSARVSMGHVLRVPCVQGKLQDFLRELIDADAWTEEVMAIALCEMRRPDATAAEGSLDQLPAVHHRWVCVISDSMEHLEFCRQVLLSAAIYLSVTSLDQLQAKHMTHVALHIARVIGARCAGLNGEVVECPWALILQPVGHMPEAPKPRSSRSGPAPPLQQMLQTPPGTVLYEVYACPSPGAAFESGWLQLIGRIISASKFILEPISENLHQLRFRHQKKEEDYVLRPEWLQDPNSAELNPSHSACGSEHFTRLLERQQRTFDGQGGAFVADALPSSRWVWSAGMKVRMSAVNEKVAVHRVPDLKKGTFWDEDKDTVSTACDASNTSESCPLDELNPSQADWD